MTIAVASAADGAPWEAVLLAQLGRSHAEQPFQVVRRCVDVVELLAVAGSGQAVAVLVDAQLRRLDATAVDRLSAAEVAVVGVAAPGVEADTERLADAGIGFVVPADAPVEVFAAVLEAAVADRSAPSHRGAGNAFADLSAAAGPLGGDTGRPAAASGAFAGAPAGGSDSPGQTLPVGNAGQGMEAPHGKVVAVWGPTGAPGRTTTAVTLADELGRLGRRSLLVDADVYGGVVAAMFGLLDESAGLVAACRQAQSRRLDVEGLAGLCWQIGPGLRVLTGISRADRWPELRPSAVDGVLGVARALADYTVVDVGFGLEADEELSFDTLAPRRNGATLTVLADADLVLAVGSADPVGLQRLVRGLAELRAAGIDRPVWIVLNRVRRGAVAGRPGAELDAALQRFVGQSCAALLPYDLASLDQALSAGQTLAEATPASPLREAVRELAAAVSGVPAPPRRGRRRK